MLECYQSWEFRDIALIQLRIGIAVVLQASSTTGTEHDFELVHLTYLVSGIHRRGEIMVCTS